MLTANGMVQTKIVKVLHFFLFLYFFLFFCFLFKHGALHWTYSTAFIPVYVTGNGEVVLSGYEWYYDFFHFFYFFKIYFISFFLIFSLALFSNIQCLFTQVFKALSLYMPASIVFVLCLYFFSLYTF